MAESSGRFSRQTTSLPVRVEQLDAVCKNMLLSLPMNSVLAAMTAMIVWNDLDHISTLAWLATVLAMNAIRFGIATRREASRAARLQALLRLNVIGSFACGVVWAFVPAFMMNIANIHGSFLLYIIAGITAGATVQGGFYAAGNVAFIGPILGTIIVKYAFNQQEGSFPLAFSQLLYFAFLTRCGLRSEAIFKNTVLLKIEATSLAASLEREHAVSLAAAMRLNELANTDALTGLSNRAAFLARLTERLDGAHKVDQAFFLFLLDLDNFKSINDTLGHGAGDTVLHTVAARLASVVDERSVVARIGGDEFAILLPTSCSEDDAIDVAQRLLHTVVGTVDLGERLVATGVSIGIAKYPDDGATAADLLSRADLSLYAAKDGGRQRWRRFDATLLAVATRARDIEHDLTTALEDGSIQLWYQPQISLAERRLTGFEALLRWKHPVHGWLPPPQIVAAALRTHKPDILTRFVFDQACAQAKRLNAGARNALTISVNVSPAEFNRYDVPMLVRGRLCGHDIDPASIELEVTEEAFASGEEVLAVLHDLAATGIRLALDDFGKGYSNLASLRKMPFQRIKIDRAFVTGSAERPDDQALIQAIVGIGRHFGIEVTAEGIETLEDAHLVRSFGCHVGQGYLFGRAMSPAHLDAWLSRHDADAVRNADWASLKIAG